METRELRYDEKAAIRFALRHEAREMLDGLMAVLLFSDCDPEEVMCEAYVALSEMPRNTQDYWFEYG